MPVFQGSQLEEISIRILEGAGAGAEDARIVAGELRDANLVGHDSHGVMRLVQYAQQIRQGYIQPGGAWEVVRELPSFAAVDGHFNFGQVAAARALRLGIDKAKAGGTATVMIRNCCHVGRLGSDTQKAAKEGMAALMAVNTPGPGGVAPYGGMERRLGTNPICMAAPWGDSAFVLDMTTSATAEGKVRVALQKGESIPEGWIIDAEGRPSTNPGDYYADPPGAILPLGGALGFKGFGLSVMIDVFAGILSGSGVCRTDMPPGANGVWMYFIDVDQLQLRTDYDRWIETYVEHVKSARKLQGVTEILMPGEIELRRLSTRQSDGVELPDETWRQLRELASQLGVSLDGI